ncbi:TetR/AcrR family transcriptional regulator [Natronospirillum operosum]|uniref:TetR/AcrR family transcriptional regulator n=1 Tax=Natronospirillum operosum TaxID=2759953 RepID=UPI00197C0EA0|nr:TetR/AcrR family transcriptional regulator [Natronospirillum operosum]
MKSVEQPASESLSGAGQRYHHGDLAPALVQAAREILETEGLSKLSLRAAARRAGVSQAAPYHHFRDKTALLAAVAAEGHRTFTRAMVEGMSQAGTDPAERLVACGVAYVDFATHNPGLFRLMFGGTIEQCEIFPDLVAAGAASYRVLEDTVAALTPGQSEPEALQIQALDAWSTVHGLAMLMIDGGLDPVHYGLDSTSDLTRALLRRRLTPLSC